MAGLWLFLLLLGSSSLLITSSRAELIELESYMDFASYLRSSNGKLIVLLLYGDDFADPNGTMRFITKEFPLGVVFLRANVDRHNVFSGAFGRHALPSYLLMKYDASRDRPKLFRRTKDDYAELRGAIVRFQAL